MGHKKGIIPRLYETSVVFLLLFVVVFGLIYVLLAVFYPERSSLITLLSKYSFIDYMGYLNKK
jgi:predicted PurR-regulated permease PerM